jgi:hypothetical protein
MADKKKGKYNDRLGLCRPPDNEYDISLYAGQKREECESLSQRMNTAEANAL